MNLLCEECGTNLTTEKNKCDTCDGSGELEDVLGHGIGVFDPCFMCNARGERTRTFCKKCEDEFYEQS